MGKVTFKGYVKDTDPIFKNGSGIISGANLNPDWVEQSKPQRQNTASSPPPKPMRENFKTNDQFEEALGFWMQQVGPSMRLLRASRRK